MATNYRKHFKSALRAALEEGIPDHLAASRIGRFESLFEANPRIPQQLEEAGVLPSACNRIATGAKFDGAELDERFSQNVALTYHQKIEAKLCLMNLGLMDHT